MSPLPVLAIAAATFIQLYWATHHLSKNTDGGCLSNSWFCSYYTHIAFAALVVLLLYVSASGIPLLKRHPHVRFAIGGWWLAGLWFFADMEIWNAYEGSWSTYDFIETIHTVWQLVTIPFLVTTLLTLLLLYRLRFRAT